MLLLPQRLVVEYPDLGEIEELSIYKRNDYVRMIKGHTQTDLGFFEKKNVSGKWGNGTLGR